MIRLSEIFPSIEELFHFTKIVTVEDPISPITQR